MVMDKIHGIEIKTITKKCGRSISPKKKMKKKKKILSEKSKMSKSWINMQIMDVTDGTQSYIQLFDQIYSYTISVIKFKLGDNVNLSM